MTPLISVVLPCYNSAATLPWALASLAAQEYENWECIFVDNGSNDDPRALIDQVGDPRIKYFRLDKTVPRPASRQAAFDRARGDFLCMLDADDWLYPSKIKKQVEIVAQERRLALLSTGHAVVDEQNEITGVLGQGPSGEELKILGPVAGLPMRLPCFNPSIIPMKIAREGRFDTGLLRSEDGDFLTQILAGRFYAKAPWVSYAYTEFNGATCDQLVEKLAGRQTRLRRYKRSFPITSRWNLAVTAAKMITYRCAFGVGMAEYLIQRRSTRPTEAELRDFTEARKIVAKHVGQLFS